MKLLIDRKIELPEYNVGTIEILNRFSVNYIKNEVLIISPQKVTINEINMNTLFSEVLFGIPISYGFIGGEGCEFSLRIE